MRLFQGMVFRKRSVSLSVWMEVTCRNLIWSQNLQTRRYNWLLKWCACGMVKLVWTVSTAMLWNYYANRLGLQSSQKPCGRLVCPHGNTRCMRINITLSLTVSNRNVLRLSGTCFHCNSSSGTGLRFIQTNWTDNALYSTSVPVLWTANCILNSQSQFEWIKIQTVSSGRLCFCCLHLAKWSETKWSETKRAGHKKHRRNSQHSGLSEHKYVLIDESRSILHKHTCMHAHTNTHDRCQSSPPDICVLSP